VAASRPRPSADEREQVVERLRGACADDRLSVQTFVARLESVYSVRTQAELALLLADLPETGWLSRVVFGAVSSASRWTHQLAVAWREPRTARLVLPSQDQVVVGRSRLCNCVISHSTVSRRHALLRSVEGRWWLRDCGSLNGTYLNGWRVVSETEVRPGDELTLGDVRFILRAPLGDVRATS
jgi:hypothetical protein